MGTVRVMVVGLAMWATSVLPAGAYCSEPSAPYCANSYGAFENEDEFNSCKSELESYKSDVEEFTGCNKREAQEAIDKAQRANEEAIGEFNEVVESFNRRASQ